MHELVRLRGLCKGGKALAHGSWATNHRRGQKVADGGPLLGVQPGAKALGGRLQRIGNSTA